MTLPFWNKPSQRAKANRYQIKDGSLPRPNSILTIIQTY